jgi:uncharacterized protein YtpQ (UPF0354 family)
MLNGNGTRLRAAWLVSIAAMVAVPAAAASPGADFTQDMLARIHTLAPSVALEVAGPLTLHVVDGPQAGGQINFDRVAAFCEHNDAAACEEQKQKFAAGMAASLVTTDYTVTRERLRVVVRSEQYATEANAELGAGKSGPLVSAPLAAGLDLVLAADFPQTTRLVKEGDLKTLGLTREQAIAFGTKQVLAALPPLPDAKALASAVIVIPGQDYGASYLLASDQWRSRAGTVTGVLWIAVPADERVVVGVARSEEELSKLKPVVAQDYSTAPRGISPSIFRWTDRGWLPLK